MFRLIKILAILLFLLFVAGTIVIIIWAMSIATSYYVIPWELLWLIPFWLLFLPLYFMLELMVHYSVNGKIISQFEVLVAEENLEFGVKKPVRPKFALWVNGFLTYAWNFIRFKKTGALHTKSFPSLNGSLLHNRIGMHINMDEQKTKVIIPNVRYGQDTLLIKSKEINGWESFKQSFRRIWARKIPFLQSPSPTQDFVFEERFEVQGSKDILKKIDFSIYSILRDNVWKKKKKVSLELQLGQLTYVENGVVEDNADRERFKKVLLMLGMIASKLKK